MVELGPGIRRLPGSGQRLTAYQSCSGPLFSPQQVKQFLLLSHQRPGLVAQCLRDSESSKPSFMPRLYINRRLAMEHRACPLRDPSCKNAVFTQVWIPWARTEGGSVRGLGDWAKGGLSKVFGPEWSQSQHRLCCNSLLLPPPQVYEGLKPSDKYEKPLDYRYGLRVRDFLRADLFTHPLPGAPLIITHL